MRKSILLACIALLFLQACYLRNLVDDLVYDNRNHYLPCDALPTYGEVMVMISQHQDVLDEIEALNPGFVGWEVHTPCEGRADLVFWYGGRSDRRKIEAIIDDATFFGIPYRLNNR